MTAGHMISALSPVLYVSLLSASPHFLMATLSFDIVSKCARFRASTILSRGLVSRSKAAASISTPFYAPGAEVMLLHAVAQRHSKPRRGRHTC